MEIINQHCEYTIITTNSRYVYFIYNIYNNYY